MRLVTFLAVGCGLFCEVSFMTLGAIRNFTVSVVAEAAGKCCMFAFVIAQFDNLACMAGHAGIGDVVAEFNI